MISRSDWDGLFLECRNIDEIYGVFKTHIRSVIDACAPLRPACRGPTRRPNYLTRLQTIKHFLWQEAKNNITEKNKSEFSKCSWGYKRACAKYYANRERGVILSRNPRSFYSYLGSRLENNEHVEGIENESGDFVTGAKKQCEEFARYFSGVYIMTVAYRSSK